MIIRRSPEDFEVEELTALQPGSGDHALYRLEKTGWTTPDALATVRRRWRIDHRRLSYGGLKDRHARTVQYFTIFHGPQRKLNQQGIEVAYLGQTEEPFTANQMLGNRFRLVLRRMSEQELTHALDHLPQVKDHGVPNYFDDQRFGSVAGGGPFLARFLLQGNYEEALKAALMAPYPHDRRPQKEEKRILRETWNDWPRAKERLPRGHARSLVDYLVHHPQDFRGAVERLRPELRGLYLSAYQSHLWNRTLAAWMRGYLGEEQFIEVPLLLGPVPMHRGLSPEHRAVLEGSSIPLASSKTQFAADDPAAPYFKKVLEEEGVALEQFRLKGLREMFFSRGERPALCLPADLAWNIGADEVHPKKKKLTLTFNLPRGSYATLVVKRISMTTESDFPGMGPESMIH